VPVLVVVMVVARAMSPGGMRVVQAETPDRSLCPGQVNADVMRAPVAQQRDRVACERRAIQ
jgi:hypothetical protein